MVTSSASTFASAGKVMRIRNLPPAATRGTEGGSKLRQHTDAAHWCLLWDVLLTQWGQAKMGTGAGGMGGMEGLQGLLGVYLTRVTAEDLQHTSLLLHLEHA